MATWGWQTNRMVMEICSGGHLWNLIFASGLIMKHILMWIHNHYVTKYIFNVMPNLKKSKHNFCPAMAQWKYAFQPNCSFGVNLGLLLIMMICTGLLGVSVSVAHDDIIKWKKFLHYWPFVQGIHRSLVNSPHKGQWRGALMFSLICTWIYGWVNIREPGTHYDITVKADVEQCL